MPLDRSARRDGVQRHQGRRERLARTERRVHQRIDALENEIYAIAGRPFNIDSPKQLAEVLFDELKLPVIKQDEDRPQHRCRRARRARHDAHPLPAGRSSSIASTRSSKARTSTRCRSMIHPDDGPRAYVVQSGRRRDGPAQFQRPELAEHSDSHGPKRPRDSLGVRRRRSRAGRC